MFCGNRKDFYYLKLHKKRVFSIIIVVFCNVLFNLVSSETSTILTVSKFFS